MMGSGVRDGLDGRDRTEVLVVGGGVTGLTASLLLSRLGVDHVLVERHEGTALVPKGHIINQRAMEIFRDVGVADDIYAIGCPPEKMSTISWMTSLAGPTPLHGRRLARTDAWCGGPGYTAASPCRPTNLPQLRLEPVLRRHAERRPKAQVAFGHELLSVSDSGDEVTAVIRDRARDTRHALTAKYVIAADGGRSVGPALGVRLHGQRTLLDMVSTHFSADMTRFWPDESVVICFSINPDGEGSLGSGVLLPMGPDMWGGKSREWQYHSALHAGDPDQFDTPLMLSRMRAMLGLPNLDAEIHSVSRWRFEATLAERYRAGRCFFAGDAAHRHPPNGGLGLNTAVADVHNLAWKLALVLSGVAGDGLLDSYEAERRPVGAAVVERAVDTWQAHIGIDEALGLADARDRAHAWERIGEYLSDTAAGERRRARVRDAVAVAAREFTGQDIELGYRYASGAIIGDTVGAHADVADPPLLDPDEFRPGTAPGKTVPHAWLTSPQGERRSTLDLATGTAFALYTAPAAAGHWRRAVRTAMDALQLPDGLLAVHAVGAPGAQPDDRGGGWQDTDGTWSRVRGTSDTGAVLARPDRHVAWRAGSLPGDPAASVRSALESLLAIGTQGSDAS